MKIPHLVSIARFERTTAKIDPFLRGDLEAVVILGRAAERDLILSQFESYVGLSLSFHFIFGPHAFFDNHMTLL